MVAQLMTSATAITRTGNKHIDTDTQARLVFDRMAHDFALMVKRTDVDYFLKGGNPNYNGHGHGNNGNGHGWGRSLQAGQQGSDQIAVISQVAGYYPQTALRSPISLVAYRVNQGSSNNNRAYLRLERMGKGLLWNGVSNSTNPPGTAVYPIVFLPQTIDAVGNWSAAINNDTSNASSDPDNTLEVIGPGVFRFEYCYLLKNGLVTDIPWDQDARPAQRSLTNPVNIGLTDVEAIAVATAVIDPASRALIDAASSSSLFDIISDMAEFRSSYARGVDGGHRIGDMVDSWKTTVEMIIATGRTSSTSPVPAEAAKAIRIYSRYFDLKSL
jgi:hypothetical protein